MLEARSLRNFCAAKITTITINLHSLVQRSKIIRQIVKCSLPMNRTIVHLSPMTYELHFFGIWIFLYRDQWDRVQLFLSSVLACQLAQISIIRKLRSIETFVRYLVQYLSPSHRTLSNSFDLFSEVSNSYLITFLHRQLNLDFLPIRIQPFWFVSRTIRLLYRKILIPLSRSVINLYYLDW